MSIIEFFIAASAYLAIQYPWIALPGLLLVIGGMFLYILARRA